jgi:3-hydroxybutyryl-CoA dehydrogenase
MMEFRRVAVVGAGTIGLGVATDLILHDIDTVLIDISAEQLDRARIEIVKNVRFAPLLMGNAPRIGKEEALKRVLFTQNMSDVAHCQFVVENVTEDWATKEKVYRQLDQVAAPEVCFGVNTSCISITRIGGATKRPDKIVGIHFMNPVHLKATVEVIRGWRTSEDTLAKVVTLLGQLNKQGIVVGDYPGFVSNRIFHLFMNEAVFVLQDQVASAQEVDAIFKKCFGHTMGPLETADLIGLDTVMRSLDVLYESYQDPKFRCCPLLRKMVYAGYLGRKSGKGFYEYLE